MPDDVTKCPACGEPLPAAPDATDSLTLDGETFEFDKLTYGERKQIKRVLRDIVLMDDESADPETDWTQDDLRLSFAVVCARRAQPEFSIEDGLKLTPAELSAPAVPPTKPRAKPRAVKAA